MSIEIYGSTEAGELNIKFSEDDFIIVGKNNIVMSKDVEALAILLVKFIIQSQLENLTSLKRLTFNTNLFIEYSNDKQVKIDCVYEYPEQWDKFKNTFEKYFALKAFW